MELGTKVKLTAGKSVVYGVVVALVSRNNIGVRVDGTRVSR